MQALVTELSNEERASAAKTLLGDHQKACFYGLTIDGVQALAVMELEDPLIKIRIEKFPALKTTETHIFVLNPTTSEISGSSGTLTVYMRAPRVDVSTGQRDAAIRTSTEMFPRRQVLDEFLAIAKEQE